MDKEKMKKFLFVSMVAVIGCYLFGELGLLLTFLWFVI